MRVGKVPFACLAARTTTTGLQGFHKFISTVSRQKMQNAPSHGTAAFRGSALQGLAFERLFGAFFTLCFTRHPSRDSSCAMRHDCKHSAYRVACTVALAQAIFFFSYSTCRLLAVKPTMTICRAILLQFRCPVTQHRKAQFGSYDHYLTLLYSSLPLSTGWERTQSNHTTMPRLIPQAGGRITGSRMCRRGWNDGT